MTIPRHPILLALFLFGAGQAHAAVDTFECTFRKAIDGWISETVYVSIDSATSQSMVLDYFVHKANNKKPITAKFKTRRNGAYQVSWAVSGLKPSNQTGRIRVNWTMRMDPKTGSAQINGNLQGNAVNTPRSTGTCKKIAANLFDE